MKQTIKGTAFIVFIISLSSLCSTASAAASSTAEDLYHITCTISDAYAAIGISDIYTIPAAIIAAVIGVVIAVIICLIAAFISKADRREMNRNELLKGDEKTKK